MARSIFDVESEDKVESPERLNEYIRVAGPGVWVVVAALAIVLAAFLIWGFTGSIPGNIHAPGVVDNMNSFCVDVAIDASKFNANDFLGKTVSFTLPDKTTGKGIVIGHSELPFSKEEIAAELNSDFLATNLATVNYSYILFVEPEKDLDAYKSQLADCTITVGTVRPIQYLMNQ